MLLIVDLIFSDYLLILCIGGGFGSDVAEL